MTDTKKLLELSAPIIANLSNDVIAIFGRTGNFLYINDRVEKWLGYLPSELIGKNIAFVKLMPPEFLKKALKNLLLRFLGRNVPPYNLEFTSKKGETFTTTINAQLVRDEEGRVVGDLVLITDISQTEYYQKALNLERQKTDAYINNSSMIMVVLDADGIATFINQTGLKTLGFSSLDEVVGKAWFENFHQGEAIENSRRVFQAALADKFGPNQSVVAPILCSDGRVVPIEWHVSVIKDEEGKTINVIGSGVDVTQRVKTEEVLKTQTEELQRMNSLMLGRETKMLELKQKIKDLGGTI